MSLLFKKNEIILINKDKCTLVNPLEDLDEDEKIAILQDILKSDPIQNSLNINDQSWEEVKSVFGEQKTEKICDYNCKRFKVTVQA